MLLIFFDEVKIQPDYPIYHIGGVCIDEEHISAIEKEISAIAKDIFGTTKLSRETEIHAHHIYGRKGVFGTMNNFDDRVKILERLIRILGREEVKLIDVQIDSSKPKASVRPAEIAFMFFCERADQLSGSLNKMGMLIGDRENDGVSERYAVNLSHYRVARTEFMFGHEIKHLFESVHFTHSHLSRFLQLADVYTWLRQFIRRHLKSEDARHRAVLDILRPDDINLFPAKYKHWPR